MCVLLLGCIPNPANAGRGHGRPLLRAAGPSASFIAFDLLVLAALDLLVLPTFDLLVLLALDLLIAFLGRGEGDLEGGAAVHPLGGGLEADLVGLHVEAVADPLEAELEGLAADDRPGVGRD